jgi:hypothetical protein
MRGGRGVVKGLGLHLTSTLTAVGRSSHRYVGRSSHRFVGRSSHRIVGNPAVGHETTDFKKAMIVRVKNVKKEL